ncbi:MAG: hypothetical protein A3I83_07405 [Methylotenera sp. RIFCSPLOWO2_02_FULL_45_14]|nr:MAG: hypothetical protein A3I83_07405 [Methylotenera sp. RIFCSPLOWO2_02_FULL_45_14]
MIAAFRLRGLKALGAIGLIFTTMLVYADEHAHKPSGQATEHTLKPGEKWETDEVVRLGMDNIRQAVSASQDDIIKGRLSTQDYQRIANVIDKNVAEIVKKCRLSQNADKAFHAVVLVDLMGGVEFMRTSQNVQAQRVGALGVLQTLHNYGKYFQHTGWSLDVIKSR